MFVRLSRRFGRDFVDRVTQIKLLFSYDCWLTSFFSYSLDQILALENGKIEPGKILRNDQIFS